MARSELEPRGGVKAPEKKAETKEVVNDNKEKEEKEYRAATDKKINELLDKVVSLEGKLKDKDVEISALKDKQNKVRELAGVGDISQ